MIALAVAALVVMVASLRPAQALPRLVRLTAVALLAGAMVAYFWAPFLMYTGYFNVSPYLERWKLDSYGAISIMTSLVGGDLLDRGRLPVMTALLALGVAGAALAGRAAPARVGLWLLAVMLLLSFGRVTWGTLADLMPVGPSLSYLRFIGGVQIAAIVLVGVGGEWLWRRFAVFPEPWRALLPAILIAALMVPALWERYGYYSLNRLWIERARAALEADPDQATILETIRALPPGRVYAGLHTGWGDRMRFGDLRFADLLPFYGIDAVAPPYTDWSLNADLIWHFGDHNPAHYDLFNARYVVAPAKQPMAPFLKVIKKTGRYTLYEAPTSGYGEFVFIPQWLIMDSQSALFESNRNWMLSDGPGARNFIRYTYLCGPLHGSNPGNSTTGVIRAERVSPQRFEFDVDCTAPSSFVIKASYHPGWTVTVDGGPTDTFMVSPSFIGVTLPAGHHLVVARYGSIAFKNILLVLGIIALVAAIAARRRLEAAVDGLAERVGALATRQGAARRR
jgi:hypothetical protein